MVWRSVAGCRVNHDTREMSLSERQAEYSVYKRGTPPYAADAVPHRLTGGIAHAFVTSGQKRDLVYL